jgi:hypothetical protein
MVCRIATATCEGSHVRYHSNDAHPCQTAQGQPVGEVVDPVSAHRYSRAGVAVVCRSRRCARGRTQQTTEHHIEQDVDHEDEEPADDRKYAGDGVAADVVDLAVLPRVRA